MTYSARSPALTLTGEQSLPWLGLVGVSASRARKARALEARTRAEPVCVANATQTGRTLRALRLYCVGGAL